MSARLALWCAALLALGGCAQVHVFSGYEWQRVAEVDAAVIVLVAAEDPGAVCAEHYGPGYRSTDGCAIKPLDADGAIRWRDPLCLVVLGVDPHPEQIGHEAAHCFGWLHPR